MVCVESAIVYIDILQTFFIFHSSLTLTLALYVQARCCKTTALHRVINWVLQFVKWVTCREIQQELLGLAALSGSSKTLEFGRIETPGLN